MADEPPCTAHVLLTLCWQISSSCIRMCTSPSSAAPNLDGHGKVVGVWGQVRARVSWWLAIRRGVVVAASAASGHRLSSSMYLCTMARRRLATDLACGDEGTRLGGDSKGGLGGSRQSGARRSEVRVEGQCRTGTDCIGVGWSGVGWVRL